MSKTCRPSPSTADAEWTVRQVVPRSDWDNAIEPCPTCGDDVDRSESHYQVELDRARTPGQETKLTRERRLLFFCDAACATAWLDSPANP